MTRPSAAAAPAARPERLAVCEPRCLCVTASRRRERRHLSEFNGARSLIVDTAVGLQSTIVRGPKIERCRGPPYWARNVIVR